jgi:competence protein ComEC
MVTILLPGDIEREAERILAESGSLSPVDVLKLPHHGSVTSSSPVFLDATVPKIAVASVGLFNPYGIPHQPVQRRLKERKTTLFRTDRHGALRLITDGRQIEFRPLKK